MPAPPYSAGTDAPSSPSSAICGRRLAIEPVLAVEIANARRDLARSPLADGLLEQLVLVGQVEIDHECGPCHTLCSSTGSPTRDARAARPRSARVRRALEVVGAAEQRADLAGRDVGVGRDDARDRLARRPSAAARRCPSVSRSHDLRSRFVTTLPNRSMRTTTPRRTPSSSAAAAGRAGESR